MRWFLELFESTTFLTVLSGVIVFTLGQIFIEFALKPIQKYKELKADSAFCLRFYRSYFINCEQNGDAQRAAKDMAARFWFFNVRKENLLKCCENLTLLAYSVGGGDSDKSFLRSHECEKEIVKTLNLFWSS